MNEKIKKTGGLWILIDAKWAYIYNNLKRNISNIKNTIDFNCKIILNNIKTYIIHLSIGKLIILDCWNIS